MPKLVLPLSDTQIKTAKPKDKQYKLFDGDGLYIVIYPNGIKRWNMNYTYDGKAKVYPIGKYPDVSLRKARDVRADIKEKIRTGENPSKKKDSTTINTFEKIAMEYFGHREDITELTRKDSISKLQKDIFPRVGTRDIKSIEPLEMLNILKIIDNRGANVTAKKVFSIIDRIYRYAVTLGKADRNIMNDLDKSIAFRVVKKNNFAHTTDENELRELLLAIDNYGGNYNTKMALKILPYVFVRPANIRYMLWSEIDFKKKLWTIPKEKMKMQRDHITPLTDTVLEVLEEMKASSYDVSKFVFPSVLKNTEPLSENTLNFALKRMGFNVTSHGFRHTASTLLHENITKHKIQSDAIEMQMAHTVGSSVKQVYNKALYLDERIELMQWWSDYLDELKISTPKFC